MGVSGGNTSVYDHDRWTVNHRQFGDGCWSSRCGASENRIRVPHGEFHESEGVDHSQHFCMRRTMRRMCHDHAMSTSPTRSLSTGSCCR